MVKPTRGLWARRACGAVTWRGTYVHKERLARERGERRGRGREGGYTGREGPHPGVSHSQGRRPQSAEGEGADLITDNELIYNSIQFEAPFQARLPRFPSRRCCDTVVDH